MKTRKRPEGLRSHRWLGVNDLRSFGHRARLRQGGYDAADWQAKPVIGIVNTWSDINFCHTHLRARAEDVKRASKSPRASSRRAMLAGSMQCTMSRSNVFRDTP